ncbi:hypothetical protein C0991_004069 [Blastosporella zonata]|nr:hypothetical protein C0991_004069 [Blastosporella zonata]
MGSLTPIPHTMQLPLSSIFSNYTHVVFATGCTLPTMHPSLPLSPYCVPALSLVHWYTQYPAAPPPPSLEHTTHVSLIGNGNVSLDVARMLLTPPEVLEKYDVPRPVLDVLSRSKVKHVSIFGRRGPLEAAFTTKELRELINLPNSAMVPVPQSILDETAVGETTRQQGRILQLLRKGSKNPFGTTEKTWSLDFFRAPTRLEAPLPGSNLAKLTLAHTALNADHGKAMPTGETSVIDTSLVITSLGFRAEPQAPFYDSTVGHLRTTPGGRVVDPGDGEGGAALNLKNIYASGWAATGAKGVLAATMMNAYAVADTILSDWLPGPDVHTTPVPTDAVTTDKASDSTPPPKDTKVLLNPTPHPEDPPVEVVQGLREGVVTEYGDWKRVDAEEVRRGAEIGKERERMGWEDARLFLGRQ